MDINGVIPSKSKSRGIPGRILRRWIDHNIRLAEEWWDHKDVPWWYNERALVSLFAGAVWSEQGMALEEFAVEKKARHEKARTRERDRQDIYFKIGKYAYIGEAKRELSLIHKPEQVYKLNEALEKAVHDIKQSSRKGMNRIALLFVLPKIQKGDLPRIDGKHIREWLDAVEKEVKYSCCAWVFPQKWRNFQTDSFGGVYPGAVLLIKEIN